MEAARDSDGGERESHPAIFRVVESTRGGNTAKTPPSPSPSSPSFFVFPSTRARASTAYIAGPPPLPMSRTCKSKPPSVAAAPLGALVGKPPQLECHGDPARATFRSRSFNRREGEVHRRRQAQRRRQCLMGLGLFDRDLVASWRDPSLRPWLDPSPRRLIRRRRSSSGEVLNLFFFF
ncbi:hypothetical protein TIFTF001_029286 [Ficus carica]|uniref:Uncharacterized protein n=1 Tax=Ficus carica TaxID=3494 RepID=A0AA88DRH8_FICCA|nr:hypothetical protein TIFTF001_029286 [Ficus carica]